MLPTTVKPDAFTSTLFALGSLTTVRAHAFASTLFALASHTTVRAEVFHRLPNLVQSIVFRLDRHLCFR